MIVHPRTESIASYVEGKLSDPQAKNIAAHLNRCQRCRERANILKKMRPALTLNRNLSLDFTDRVLSHLPETKRVSQPACGEVKAISGCLMICRNGADEAIEAFPKMGILEGDTLRVVGNSLALIDLNDGSTLYLNKETEVQFFKRDYPLSLHVGELLAMMKPQGKPFEIWTPAAVLGVVGTDFDTTVQDKKTTLKVLKGKVSFQNDAGKTVVKQKRQVEAERYTRPIATRIRDTRSVSRWTGPISPRMRRRGAMAKNLGLVVVLLAVVIGGMFYFQKQKETEGRLSSERIAQSEKTEPLELVSPYKQEGMSWRTRVNEQMQRGNSWIDMSTLVIRSDIIRVDEENGASVLLTLEDDKISIENPDAEDWANETAAKMIGRQFEYSVSPEGKAHSSRTADGKPLEHLEILLFSLVRMYSDFTGLYIKKPLTPGDQWAEQYEDKIPGYPNSYVKGEATYQFVNYEVRNGVEYAIIQAESTTSLGGGILIQRTVEPKATRDFQLDQITFVQKGEYSIDVKSGRVVSGTCTYKFGTMKSTLTSYIAGRKVPFTEKIEKESGGTMRAFLTMEYMP